MYLHVKNQRMNKKKRYTVNSEVIACIYYCDSSTTDKNARFNYCDAPR